MERGEAPQGHADHPNTDVDTTLIAESVTALCENGGTQNYGLYDDNGAEAGLLGGAFTGRGGTEARGISNNNSNLFATNVTALGAISQFIKEVLR